MPLRTGRVFGESRVGTAVAVSRHAFPTGAREAYLARADVLADAVAAGSLTAGPVLLVPLGAVPSEVVAEVGRLAPERVVAVGGDEQVPEETLAAVAAGRPTGRLAGDTRVGTAVAVARHQFPHGAAAVHLVAADAVPDAVVAGSLTGGPLLLVPGCDLLPTVVAREIARLGPSRVMAIGGPAAVCTDVLLEAAGLRPQDCGPPFVDDRGTASVASPVVGAALGEGRLFVATRGRVPAVVAAVDADTDTVTQTAELPTGAGAWALGLLPSGDLLVGTYQPADLYRLDARSLRVRRVASFDGSTHIYCLATAPDGVAYLGTLPDGAVHAYDPQSGRVRDYGAAAPGEYLVRSIAVDDSTIYAGVGARAHLVAIDRRTGDRRDILPRSLRDESFVYTLDLASRRLVAGTEPSGRLAVVAVDDPGDHRVLPSFGERTLDAIAVAGDTVYLTGRTTGALYRYELGADGARRLAVPLAREETRGLFVRDGVVLGVGGTGVLWRYGLDSGHVTTTDLGEAGVPGGPEPVQSIAASDAAVYVGAHWAVQIHGVDREAADRVRVPGEPKAMVDVDGVLYLALYPGAEVWRYDPGVGAPVSVATIGHEQARPRRMAVDTVSGRVLVVSQADYGHRGGALTVHDPATGAVSVYRDVVAGHGLSAVGVADGVAYVGSEVRSGGGTPPAEGSSRVAAWDLATARTRWETVPVEGAAAIVDVVAAHGLVYGLTAEGTIFSLNPGTQQTVRAVRLAASGRALAMQDGLLYAASRRGLDRIHLDTLATTSVLSGPDITHVTAGPDCTLFVARAGNLLQVNP